LFGMCFPVGAFIFEFLNKGLSFDLSNLTVIHTRNKLLFMIDTAPVFLGLFAFLGGIYQQRSSKLLKEFRKISQQLIENSDKLENNARVSIQVIQSNLVRIEDMVLSHSSINNDISEAFTNVQNNTNGMNSEVEFVKGKFEDIFTKSDLIEKEYKMISDLLEEFTVNLNKINSTHILLNDLGHQIDILAVNSGIEAIKLGSAGSTFGVVADNIRELSAKTNEVNDNLNLLLMNVSQEVQNLLNGLQQGMEINKELLQICRLVEKSISNYTSVADLFAHQLVKIKKINQYELDKRRELENTIQTVNSENKKVSEELQSIVTDELAIIDKIKSFERK
jgi:methyl-accepting chemotaxis protein